MQYLSSKPERITHPLTDPLAIISQNLFWKQLGISFDNFVLFISSDRSSYSDSSRLEIQLHQVCEILSISANIFSYFLFENWMQIDNNWPYTSFSLFFSLFPSISLFFSFLLSSSLFFSLFLSFSLSIYEIHNIYEIHFIHYLSVWAMGVHLELQKGQKNYIWQINNVWESSI